MIDSDDAFCFCSDKVRDFLDFTTDTEPFPYNHTILLFFAIMERVLVAPAAGKE